MPVCEVSRVVRLGVEVCTSMPSRCGKNTFRASCKLNHLGQSLLAGNVSTVDAMHIYESAAVPSTAPGQISRIFSTVHISGNGEACDSVPAQFRAQPLHADTQPCNISIRRGGEQEGVLDTIVIE
jgi:hypothetical protein